jgi:hypothetical protein
MAKNIFDRARQLWPDVGSVDKALLEQMIAEDFEESVNGHYVGLTGRISIESRLEYDDEPGGDRMDFLSHGLSAMARVYGSDGNTRNYTVGIPSMFFIFRHEPFTQEEATDFITEMRRNYLWEERFKGMIIDRCIKYMKLNKNPAIDDATRLFVEML